MKKEKMFLNYSHKLTKIRIKQKYVRFYLIFCFASSTMGKNRYKIIPRSD